jgi:Ca-activated chloride channel family protein
MFGIVAPLALTALPVILCVALIIARRQIRRKVLSAKIGFSGTVSPVKTTLLSIIPLLAMGFALLRPYAGTTEFSVPSATDDYMFVVDVSRSMYARDVPPSRMELAKRKLKDLIGEYKRRGEPHRYGITLFAGYSYLLCPMTDDTSVLQQFISEISPEMVTSLGSNLEAGISTALSRFDERTSPNARILLISDGEDDVLEVDRVISLIQEKKIRVDVLGVGTTQGTTIQFDNGAFLKDSSGTLVQTHLEEGSLKKIATAASGVYVRATLDDSDITALTRERFTTRSSTDQKSRIISSFNEFGSWFALAALVMIVLSTACVSLRHIVRTSLFVLLPLAFANATPHPQEALEEVSPRKAFELYNAGDYERAQRAFGELLKKSPTDHELQQSYASALFKAGKFKEAQELFHKLASDTKEGRTYFENTYNEGNALLALQRYRDAMDAFAKALDVKPNDERARHNREVAQALWEEEKKRPTPTPTPTPTPQPSQPPQDSPSASPSPQESSSPEQQKTPQPSVSPQETSPQNGSPSPQTPNPSSSPSPSQETPSSSPSPEPNNTPEPQGTRLKENQPEDASQAPQAGSPSAEPTLPAKAPSALEAEAWLESLPESPLLIRRERGRAKQGGQTW